jgi:hypothetical protein
VISWRSFTARSCPSCHNRFLVNVVHVDSKRTFAVHLSLGIHMPLAQRWTLPEPYREPQPPLVSRFVIALAILTPILDRSAFASRRSESN